MTIRSRHPPILAATLLESPVAQSVVVTLDVEQSGTLAPWIEIPSTWTEISNSPLGDGIGEIVTFRRDSALTGEIRGLFRVRGEKP